MADDTVTALRAPRELDVHDLAAAAWRAAPTVALTQQWSGEPAPAHRHAHARVLWTPDALHVHFDCVQDEPLIQRAQPDRTRKVMGLWDHDVCEVFVAPDPQRPEHYYEFEVAPTAEWLDVEISWRPEGRVSNWQYASGMHAAARIEPGRVELALAVPWSALGGAPQAGDVWRVNLFRCVGPLGPDRGYLAWRPTHTPEPAFHVPAAFGHMRFCG